MTKIELKSVKTFRGTEGNGFNATVYIDGVKVGTVDDDANGGCYHYNPHSLRDRIDKIAKTEHKFEFKHELADQLIGRLIDHLQVEKQAKRLLKDKLAFIGDDGKLYNTTKLTSQRMSDVLANPKPSLTRLKGTRFVTDLDELVALMIAQSGG